MTAKNISEGKYFENLLRLHVVGLIGNLHFIILLLQIFLSWMPVYYTQKSTLTVTYLWNRGPLMVLNYTLLILDD